MRCLYQLIIDCLVTEIINTEDLLKASIAVMTASVTETPFAHRLTINGQISRFSHEVYVHVYDSYAFRWQGYNIIHRTNNNDIIIYF